LPETYLLLFFSGTAYLLIDIGISAADLEITGIRQLRLEKADKLIEDKQIRKEAAMRASGYLRDRPKLQESGFAYSGSAGNAPLVTDGLRSRFMNAFAGQLSLRMELEAKKERVAAETARPVGYS
jgi:hypothetical protein